MSLDVKSLYTNVTLKEAIVIALQKLYSQESPPEIQRATMKRLLNMAVSKVYLKCNDSWYVQVDGLAMGASLAVILAKLWLKEYKFALRQEVPVGTEIQQINDKTVCAHVAAGKPQVDQSRLNARVAETCII